MPGHHVGLCNPLSYMFRNIRGRRQASQNFIRLKLLYVEKAKEWRRRQQFNLNGKIQETGAFYIHFHEVQ